MNNYEIETEEYLNHNIRLFQLNLFGATELEHVQVYCGFTQPYGLIVDLGCGIGEMGALIAQVIPTTHTINVTNCKVQCEYMANLNRTFVLADYHNTELPDAIADTVMFNESFGYGDMSNLLKEVSRLLKTNGQLIIKDVTPLDPTIEDPIIPGWDYKVNQTSKLIKTAEENNLHLSLLVHPQVYKTRLDVLSSGKFEEWHSSKTSNIQITDYPASICKFIKIKSK